MKRATTGMKENCEKSYADFYLYYYYYYRHVCLLAQGGLS